MNSYSDPTTVFVIAVLIAVSAQLASERMRLPPIFLWLLAGMGLGPFGLHLLQTESIEPAHTLVELGLAIILFEGGMNLNLKALKEHRTVVGRLVILGPILTMFIGGISAHYLTGLSWSLSLLFGAIISIGGPTVITPIIRQVRLDREISHILSSEAMLVDAVGAILAIVMLQLTLLPDANAWSTFQDILIKLGVGAFIGIAGGWLIARALHFNISHNLEMRTIFTLACSWGIYLLANSLSEQAGLMAVLMAGTTLQRPSPFQRKFVDSYYFRVVCITGSQPRSFTLKCLSVAGLRYFSLTWAYCQTFIGLGFRHWLQVNACTDQLPCHDGSTRCCCGGYHIIICTCITRGRFKANRSIGRFGLYHHHCFSLCLWVSC
jgi:NhaP-type Na+/H+ or K+/H+ antiporter